MFSLVLFFTYLVGCSNMYPEKSKLGNKIMLLSSKAGHLRYFGISSIIEYDFLFFHQVNLTGSGLFK